MNECPLCSIPKREILLYETTDLFLVSTKDLKGHITRVMICLKVHVANPTFEETTKAHVILYDYMKKEMGNNSWYVVDGIYGSIPDHFHIVACDKESTDPKEVEQLAKTPKVEFPLFHKRVLVGIPAFNEERTIQDIIVRSSYYGDVLVLNDGSTDKTEYIARTVGAKVANHLENEGYGSTLKDIFALANELNYDILVTLDADGQHNPDEIPKFLEALNSNTDIVIGNRFLSQTPVPCVRSFGVSFISKLQGFSDAQCGFRVYNKKAIQMLVIKEKGMGASLEILQKAQDQKLRIAEIPCTVSYTDTKHTYHPLKHGSLLLESFLWSKVWRHPFTYLGIPALLFLLLGLVSLVQLLNLYVQFRVFVVSWTALTLGGLSGGTILSSSSILLYLLKRALEEVKS